MLSTYLGSEARESGNVSARSRKAGDNFRPNRVIIKPHDNGDRSSCFFGGARCRRPTCNDNGELQTHEFGRKRGDAIEFSVRISLLNDDVFPVGVSKVA